MLRTSVKALHFVGFLGETKWTPPRDVYGHSREAQAPAFVPTLRLLVRSAAVKATCCFSATHGWNALIFPARCYPGTYSELVLFSNRTNEDQLKHACECSKDRSKKCECVPPKKATKSKLDLRGKRR